MEDLNYKFNYGNNLEEITVSDKTFKKHMFENRKDVFFNNYTLEDRKFNEYDSFCQNISYQDSSKETFVKLQLTDSVGNTGYVTYAIPPYNSVLYVQFTGKVTNKGIFTSHVYSEVNPDYTFYLCTDNRFIFYSNWSQPFERTVETFDKPVISLKSVEPGPLNTDRYYFDAGHPAF